MRMSLLGVLLAISGCLGTVDGDPIPQDKLYFPSFLLQNNNTLYVVNSNLDLQFKTGSISQIDLASHKITQLALVPSLTGQIIANSDFSTLFITSQQKNSILNPLSGSSLSLQYNAPYFLAFSADQKSGLLGYLNFPLNEPWDRTRFSLVADQPELQSFTYDPINGIKITQSYQVATCFALPARTYRRIARLGGVSIKENYTYVLAEFFIDDPVDNNKFSKRVFLIRTVPKSNLCDDLTTKLDITKTEKAQAARDLVITDDEKTAYALLDENPVLLKIDLSTQNITRRASTCKGPATLKLSHDTQTLFVACPKTNELIAYNAADLGVFGKYNAPNLKGGPLDVLFEQTPDKLNTGRIFVTYQQDHAIGIFTYYEKLSPDKRSLSFVEWLQLPR